MSYTPEGVSLPHRFKKQTPRSSNFNQSFRHRLVVVDGYDTSRGVMRATELDTDRKIEVTIRSGKSSSTRSRSDWSGNLIDERMEKAIPEGNKVILENCLTTKKIKSGSTGDELSIMECGWVASMPDQEPGKSFSGLITGNAYKDRYSGVQLWDKQRGAINPETTEGEAAIEELAQEMNEVVDHYNSSPQNARLITRGVQFRTLVKRENPEDGRPYEVVDTSPPFDWVRAKKDANDNVITEGHPLSGDEMISHLEGYLDYVYGSEEDEDLPGLVAEGVIGKDQQFHVEVLSYKAMSAAPLSDFMEIKRPKVPMYVLANTMTKYSQLSDAMYMGKNWGAYGIAVLTSDQAPKKKGEDFVERNLVTRLFINGFGFNLQTMIAAYDGGKVKIHPSLDRIRDMENENANKASSNDEVASSPTLTPSSEPESAAFDDDDDDSVAFFSTELEKMQQEGQTDVSDDKEAKDKVDAESDVSQEQEEKQTSKPAGKRFRRST